MSNEIITALITGGLALIGVVISQQFQNKRFTKDLENNNIQNQKKTEEKFDVAMAIINERIEELTREVRKHNNFAERIPRLEANQENIKEDIKELRNKK